MDGVDYFFLPREVFEAERDQGQFLEWAEVHGNLYGTPAGPVRDQLAQGCCVILEIDVQGARIVHERVPSAIRIFINAPNFEVLEQRLRARATDDEATIQRRLANARSEIEQASQYHHQITNDDLERATDELVEILARSYCKG